VALGGVLPGDDQGAHRRGDPRQVGLPGGAKENVILGKLIPAGTGLDRYRNIRVEPTAEARASAYDLSYDPYDYDIAGSSPSVPLDEFDIGDLR